MALLVFGAIALPAHAASGPATSVRTVSPVDASGQLKAGYRVTRHESHGSCQSGSFMTGRADRCSTPESGAVVLDPCWPTATAEMFVCEAKPWRHQVVQVHAAGPVHGGPGRHRPTLPWGMRIRTGVHCLLDPGSVRRLNGHPLLFHCSHHLDVFGPLRSGGAHWTAHVYRAGARTRSGYRSRGWQPVRVAWYGAAPAPPPSPSPLPSLLPTLTPTVSPSESTNPTATP
ncbi:MAG TPA: hypothetical protein VHC43_10435 [Mycobacteriales bacterium]|nr:hypothetical protein [Mycobacteriales bacterium]